jgi:hypothetical protein
MIAYPAISPLTGDRCASEQAICMTGLGDRHHPDSLIDITGMCNHNAIPIIIHIQTEG